MVVRKSRPVEAPAAYLIVRVRFFPHGPDRYGADVKGGDVVGRGETPDAAVGSLRRRLASWVRKCGLPEELASAALPRRTILTHLPQAFESAAASPDGLTLRAVTWDLRGLVTALSDDELEERARALPVDRFEEGFLHAFPAAWDLARAGAFNRFLAGQNGQVAKPVAVVIRPGGSYLGEHGSDRIRLQRGLSPLATWQVFLHELAHYRVRHHGEAFALELARVYRLWRQWAAGPLLPGVARAASP